MHEFKLIGIDVGSTTIKLAVLNHKEELLLSKYKRHYSDIDNALKEMFNEVYEELKDQKIKVKVTGSGGLGISNWLAIEFVQEVIACSFAVNKYIPHSDVAIELGGEDAKITYFGDTIDQRMNGSCAGGTGAFIDQMAVLLDTDANGLNELAKKSDKIYPIAARCGVFAKTDIQPLINEGVSKDNIAASIYQAVVNQTISGLAAGKPIKGNVAFLGGPLSYSDQLRKRFIDTLQLANNEVVLVENSMLFVAIGTALNAIEQDEVDFNTLHDTILNTNMENPDETMYLDALFNEDDTYDDFKARHDLALVAELDIDDYIGNAYVGIDAGSTTSKLALISEDKKLLYYDYRNNLGSPLQTIKLMLDKMYDYVHPGIDIKYSCATGYGENLVQSAFKVDMGEIETLCHYRAAAFFNPDVDFILDIGGQDMKCMRIKNGVIYDIMLNEACSSGCGSFIEGFAKTLNVSLEEFVKLGVSAKNPVELGSRCTVFMNSKVKQAQKEGSSVADISAGLAYSVIKNALIKVIKVKDYGKIGHNLVVQGGTFYNDAVLKAFEKIVGQDVIRPNISGLMGAFGAAIIAIENCEAKTGILKQAAVQNLSYTTKALRCGLCENNCSLTLNMFNDGSKFITGNKCEKGAGVTTKDKVLPNIYTYKYERLFNYQSLAAEDAVRGTVGIPKALNIYEHYPFWHTFFTELGFRVKLSPRSNKAIYEMGMSTITSDTICYPAKLVNGHVTSLIKDPEIDFIFYPSLPYENKSREQAQKNYNCPVVISYPEVIKNNLEFNGVKYISPFIPFDNEDVMAKNLFVEFESLGIKKSEISRAIKKANAELLVYKQDVANKGEEILEYMQTHDLRGIVLAGRPYHIDPEISHGLEKIINELGMVCLSEDSISHLAKDDLNLRVIDQWSFHSRMYLAADYVSTNDNLELVQLTSFGCGIDAIVSEQVSEILRANGKNYSLIKIDEGSNLGAIKIRLRSIQAAMNEREKSGHRLEKEVINYETPTFTKEMKSNKNHTIIVPQMSPIHFSFLEPAMRQEGYNAVVLPSVDTKAIDIGSKYVNNDSCYPAIIVIGQLLAAIKSGKYDVNNMSVMLSQTGGGCRASNYISQLKKALVDAGYSNIPVVSFNLVGMEKQPGFSMTFTLVRKLMMGILYGDVLMRVSNRVRPYEVNAGETDQLIASWVDKIVEQDIPINYYKYRKIIDNMITDFINIERTDEIKPKVGVVGEILVKYHPTGNNNLFKTVEEEGAELVVPDLTDFVLYSAYNNIYNYNNLGGSKKASRVSKLIINMINFYRSYLNKKLKATNHFSPTAKIEEKVKALKGIISVGNQTGEGWFLTAEMMELLSHKVNNIIAVQPFGCLPNHIFAKSVIKPIKSHYPKANIISIDYDPGMSSVNQLNRIKLLLEMSKNKIL